MNSFTAALLSFVQDFFTAVTWDNVLISFPFMMVVFSILVLMFRKLVGLR